MASNTPIPPAGGDDAALLIAFTRDGESGAFTALVQRYGALVQGAAMRILRDDEPARDVAQEVFVHFARAAQRIRPESLGAWLHRAAVRSALNELRRTSRRQRRELAAMNEPLPDNSRDPAPEHWTAALDHLDDAMNHLSDTERQCIIGRFHHGRPLREIAANAGKSADAVRMIIHRALEKMCSFLRRRGVAVSSAALASGLSSEMARAAAALTHDAATALSVRALSAAKSAASVPAVIVLTTALMTKPAILTAAALLAFALAAGAGYLTNKPDKPAKMESVAGPPDKSPVATAVPGKEAPSAPASSTQPTAAEQIVTRMEALWMKKEEIIKRAPDRNPPPDPKLVMQMFTEMEALMNEMRRVTMELDAATLPDAVVIAQKKNGKIAGFLITALFEHWAGFDAEAARLAGAKLPKELSALAPAAIARGWAMTDPQAAMAAADKWHPGDRQSRNTFLKNVFDGWNRVNAAGAVRALAGLPTDDQLLVTQVFGKLEHMPGQRAAAASEIAKVEDEVLRGKLVNWVTGNWAEYDGPGAAAWFDSLAWQNPRAGLKAAMEIAGAWMDSGLDLAGAADWAWPKVPDELRTKFVKSLIQQKWAVQNRAAAEAWMNKHGITPGTGTAPGNAVR